MATLSDIPDLPLPPPDRPDAMLSERLETKYPLGEERIHEAVAEMQRRLPVYRHNGHDHDWSSIRTLYLDTPDLWCFQEYVRRLPIRRKIRIRQYGVNGRFEDRCWIELKVKHHRLSLKRRFCCLIDHLTPLLAGTDILDDIRPLNGLGFDATYHMIRALISEHALRPAVRVDYERLSFQHPDEPGLRLTLDRRLSYRSASRDDAGRLDGLVVEVKHNGTRPEWLDGLCDDLQLMRARRFSKFARSIKALTHLQQFEAGS